MVVSGVGGGSGRANDHPRVAAALGPGRAWSEVHHLDEVTSTSDVALARLRDGEPPRFVVVGDRQTAGRGRAGRGWEDGPSADASLMLTATVHAPAGELTVAPLATGLAVIDAAERSSAGPAPPPAGKIPSDVRRDPPHLSLKWPNDVLAGGRKCVGILVEHHTVAGAPVLLVGIGVDVDWRGADRSSEPGAWTSLAEVRGAAVDRFELLGELLDALAVRLAAVADDPVGLLADYRRRCVTLGQRVRAQQPGPDGRELEGVAVDVDVLGRLVVDTRLGRVAVAAGDVRHVRAR